jgi:SAM-dependent methyltransferase
VEAVGKIATNLHLPQLPAPADHRYQATLDLVIRNVSTSGRPVSFLVTETVPTEDFYDQAQGLGVEIGPGPNPRILPRDGRQVFYVERETAEEFRAKYDYKGKFESLDSPEAKAFWDQVTVGRANDIPFEDGTLDFIFSADVVEHLVNPIGHFAYWKSKLKPGGRVLAIIPHISGCGDYVNRPTPVSNWIGEYKRGGFEETVEHHVPFAAPRRIDPASLFAKGYSSHFSFFNTENLTQALEFSVERLGFKGFNIYHGRNAKKIHFALYN